MCTNQLSGTLTGIMLYLWISLGIIDINFINLLKKLAFDLINFLYYLSTISLILDLVLIISFTYFKLNLLLSFHFLNEEV